MTETNRRLTLAFVRSVANLCDHCFRRGDACKECFSATARRLLAQVEKDERAERSPDYSIAYRMARIENCLRSLSHPIPSSLIKTDDICSRQLKHWTLKHLVRLGRISRSWDVDNNRYLYSIKKEN